MQVSFLYLGLSFFINFILTIRIIKLRRKHLIGIGTSGNEELARAVRAHGNFIEHAPLILLMLMALDYATSSAYLIHALGLVLFIGRILHAYGLSKSAGKSFGRVAGMMSTFLVGLVCAGYLIVKSFPY